MTTILRRTSEEPDSGRARPRSSSRRGPSWWVYLLLTLFVLASIFPFYWMFVVGSQDSSAINDVPPAMVPGPNFWDQTLEVFNRVDFGRALLNSMIVATSIAMGQVLFSALAGYAFAKLRFPLKNTLFVFVIATMMVPLQLGVIPQFILISELGWVNDLRALIVPGIVTAFGVFWMRQAFDQGVPDELIQAAKVDGASNIRTFWSIALPVVRAPSAVLGLFAFMFAWNDFFWPLIVLNKQDSFTVQVALRQIQNQAYVTDFGIQMTATVLATIPLLVIFVVFGKQIVGGIMEGALKG